MADLKPRIDKLVGSLSRARRPAGRAQAQLPASPPLLRAGDSGFGEAVARLFAMSLDRYAREGAQLEIRVP